MPGEPPSWVAKAHTINYTPVGIPIRRGGHPAAARHVNEPSYEKKQRAHKPHPAVAGDEQTTQVLTS